MLKEKYLKKVLKYNADVSLLLKARDFESNSDYRDDVAVEIYDPLMTLLSGADFVGAYDGLVYVSHNKMSEPFIFNSTTRKSRM